MAEHLRNQMARDLLPVRPSRIRTLAQFLEPLTPLKTPTPAQVHHLIEESLQKLAIPRFQPVADFLGFRAAIASLLEELPSGAVLRSADRNLADVVSAVELALSDRGYGARTQRLAAAGQHLRDLNLPLASKVVIDGFFTFSPAEENLVLALASRTTVILTLPASPPNEALSDRLAAKGFTLANCTESGRTAPVEVFAADSIEREADGIVRRILTEHESGRHFREMGILLRSRAPYGTILETTMARFGIPFRSYFADPLASQPAIQFLTGILRALSNQWDQAELATLVRMPVSGLGATPQGDKLDFELRKLIPGRGLPQVWRDLEAISSWRKDRVDAAAWAKRLAGFAKLIPMPSEPGQDSRDEVFAMRSLAAALEGWRTLVESVAAVFPPSRQLSLSEFLHQIETAAALEQLRVVDRRREVVHIMDVFEARQWELPVVFVCGMVEYQFPRYHAENPLLGDAARRRLGLRTRDAAEKEERFLFDLAVSRATHRTVLSYARFNEKGDSQIPSFFLPPLGEVSGQTNHAAVGASAEPRIRPKPTRLVDENQTTSIHAPDLLQSLAEKHRNLSSSGIERFLQCPFQFFAEKTIRIKPRPPEPRDRLNVILQGTILHAVLAEWRKTPLLGIEIFNQVFEDHCTKERIPKSYRTEAVRLELRRNLQGFLADKSFQLGWPSRTEQSFELALGPDLIIRGRLDRIDVSPSGRALVIDYKYSAANSVREKADDTEAGDLVQGGLYMLAAQQALGYQPVGMLFCGLKKEVTWAGWHTGLDQLSRLGTAVTPTMLAEQIQTATEKTFWVREQIAKGRIAPEPSDRSKCKWCDFRDICRVGSAQAALGADA